MTAKRLRFHSRAVVGHPQKAKEYEMASKDAHDHVEAIIKQAEQAEAVVASADRERMMRDMLHAVQVQEGLIPPDSPPDFVRPEGDDALVDGLPWWFGGKANYQPTPEALAEFSTPMVPNQRDEQIELFGD
jgi:hypothetical protein